MIAIFMIFHLPLWYFFIFKALYLLFCLIDLNLCYFLFIIYFCFIIYFLFRGFINWMEMIVESYLIL